MIPYCTVNSKNNCSFLLAGFFTEEDAKKLQGKIQIKTSTVKAKKANKANMQDIKQGERQSKPTKGKKASKAKIQDKKHEKSKAKQVKAKKQTRQKYKTKTREKSKAKQ